MSAFDSWRDLPVVVVGDAILDTYLRGRVDRISPEAPVPVVRRLAEEDRPGGAANVAANVAALTARPILVSLVGDDDGAAMLRAEMLRRGVATEGLVEVRGRPTTRKVRVMAQNQQIVRLDNEEDRPVPDEVAEEIVARAEATLEGARALILSDYAKGALDSRSIPRLLAAARGRGIPAIVDPKLRHFSLFVPATVITPNQAEIAAATARELADAADVSSAAGELLGRMDVDAVLVTRGEAGMLLARRGVDPQVIPARAREVYDVTGAGDTVTAVLAVALAAGLPVDRAARLANEAASLAVGRIGTAAITLPELEQSLART